MSTSKKFVIIYIMGAVCFFYSLSPVMEFINLGPSLYLQELAVEQIWCEDRSDPYKKNTCVMVIDLKEGYVKYMNINNNATGSSTEFIFKNLYEEGPE